MDKATDFWKRAQRCEERAASARDREVRRCWQEVADAWYFAATAEERATRLIRQREQLKSGPVLAGEQNEK